MQDKHCNKVPYAGLRLSSYWRYLVKEGHEHISLMLF